MRPDWFRPEEGRPRVIDRWQVNGRYTWELADYIGDKFFAQLVETVHSLLGDGGMMVPGLRVSHWAVEMGGSRQLQGVFKAGV